MRSMISRLLACAVFVFCSTLSAHAQERDAPIQLLLQEHAEIILKSSRKTIAPAIDALASSGLPEALTVLDKWQNKDMWARKEDNLFVFGTKGEGDALRLFDVATGEEFGSAPRREFKQLKPNSGIRGMIAAALVQFQLSDPDPATRIAALEAIQTDHVERFVLIICRQSDCGG